MEDRGTCFGLDFGADRSRNANKSSVSELRSMLGQRGGVRDQITMHPLIKIVAGAAAGIGVGKLLRGLFAPDPANIIDCSQELSTYYKTYVRLPKSKQDQLREHREANRKRIMEGLAARGSLRPVDFIPQGSYAADTINQEPANEYDIDDGVVFDAAQLVGPRGAPLSALEARRLVYECIDKDPRLQIQPELLPNCVRVRYAGGYHVDLAVYRRTTTKENSRLEHASAEWHHADPRGVTEWFQKAVASKSPDKTDGGQLRRITRLVKKIATSRATWVVPSGFVLSVLVIETFKGVPERDDAALYLCLRAIRSRLRFDLKVKHPVVDEYLSKGSWDPRIVGLRKRLDKVVADLEPIIGRTRAKNEALVAWRTAFFDSSIGVGDTNA